MNKCMHTINQTKARLPVLCPQVADEIGIVERLAAERGRRHLRPFQEGVYVSEEGFSVCHAVYDIGLFLSVKRQKPISLGLGNFLHSRHAKGA